MLDLEPRRTASPQLATPDVARAALQETSALLYDRGWAFGTSGNYSIVLSRDPLRLLITASGRDKRKLSDLDFTVVDETGDSVEPATSPKPSAETLLHIMLARRPDVGAVLHTHSVWNTVLSSRFAATGRLEIAGLEMLKGLAGVTTHDTRVSIPVFANSQDIAALAQQVRHADCVVNHVPPHAFLIAGHGLYTWGRDINEARRHVEILEFLFEVYGRTMIVEASPPHDARGVSLGSR